MSTNLTPTHYATADHFRNRYEARQFYEGVRAGIRSATMGAAGKMTAMIAAVDAEENAVKNDMWRDEMAPRTEDEV